MELIRNNPKYWNFIRQLRNTNQGFIERVKITKEQQEKFMAKNNDCYYICLSDDVPVGFIGVRNNDLVLAVSQNRQRKGIGKFMVENIPIDLSEVVVKVLFENDKSHKLFESLGYKPFLIYYKKKTARMTDR